MRLTYSTKDSFLFSGASGNGTSVLFIGDDADGDRSDLRRGKGEDLTEIRN